MEATFWHRKWEVGETGFHEAEANPLLTSHFDKLNVAKGGRVFLPLCGKTSAVSWLLAGGYRVVGAELSELAITELFADLGLAPEITKLGELARFSAKDIDIFVGDIFGLSAEQLGSVDAIYDRAALVALPADMRKRYTSLLIEITRTAPQLLITYDYDQQLMDGPPFSVKEEEVKRHYAGTYHLNPVSTADIEGGLKGKVDSTETAWVLRRIDG